MKPILRTALSMALMCLGTSIALADWDLTDPHKMHYPQLPDPTGWDVNCSDYTLADDWMCSEDGPVQQIHFWISWTNDFVGVIRNIHLSIHDNIPPDPQPPFDYSRPGALLWEDDFKEGDFTIRFWENAPQGWYDPRSGVFRFDDHFMCWQVNVLARETNVFRQFEGTIYWLDIKLDVEFGLAGWKSSWTNFMDDAVFEDHDIPVGWRPLTHPPDFQETLDLSFVIDPTPEPSAGLLVTTALALLTYRRYLHI